jgi:hypothetical protein
VDLNTTKEQMANELYLWIQSIKAKMDPYWIGFLFQCNKFSKLPPGKKLAYGSQLYNWRGKIHQRKGAIHSEWGGKIHQTKGAIHSE